MDSTVLVLRVAPKSSSDAIVGWHGEALKVKVRAAPEDGRANAAVIKVLSVALNLPQKSVTITSGLISRNKRVRIHGLGSVALIARIDTLLSI